MVFEDRADAGKLLAAAIKRLNLRNKVVLGLARGGVVAAAEIAKVLKIPLEVVVFKKLGAPGNSELAIGAVGSHSQPYLDQELISQLQVTKEYLTGEIKRQRREAARRERLYRGKRKMINIKNKNVVLVDDGIATGATMLAAVAAIKKLKPKSLILAVPVAPPSSLVKLAPQVNRVLVLHQDENFRAVGQFFRRFEQVEDEQVIKMLDKNLRKD